MKKLTIFSFLFLLAVPVYADLLDIPGYTEFLKAREILDTTFSFEKNSYKVTVDHKGLLNYLEKLDHKKVAEIASIALEYITEAEFPEFKELKEKAGRKQLAKAIHNLQALTIFKACEAFLMEKLSWL